MFILGPLSIGLGSRATETRVVEVAMGQIPVHSFSGLDQEIPGLGRGKSASL